MNGGFFIQNSWQEQDYVQYVPEGVIGTYEEHMARRKPINPAVVLVSRDGNIMALRFGEYLIVFVVYM
jgi:hypothetical protein